MLPEARVEVRRGEEHGNTGDHGMDHNRKG